MLSSAQIFVFNMIPFTFFENMYTSPSQIILILYNFVDSDSFLLIFIVLYLRGNLKGVGSEYIWIRSPHTDCTFANWWCC
jgi:hypothetical protein